MDVRNIFLFASEVLLAKYKQSASITHSGGKGTVRENFFEDLLKDYLPKRYAVGSGEVITPENRVSGQLDIVIYDSFECPKLFTDESHSTFPLESVYGAISVKSNLESGDLESGYSNIGTLKKILLKGKVRHKNRFSSGWGANNPVPVTGIFAYNSKRSLEAIAEQVRDLDRNLGSIEMRPDFVAVVGDGIVGPRKPLRGDHNRYTLPQNLDDLVLLRRTGRHTLLRLYMEILRELSTIALSPFDLSKYDDMPRLVGNYRVRRHDSFITTSEVDNSSLVLKEA